MLISITSKTDENLNANGNPILRRGRHGKFRVRPNLDAERPAGRVLERGGFVSGWKQVGGDRGAGWLDIRFDQFGGVLDLEHFSQFGLVVRGFVRRRKQVGRRGWRKFYPGSDLHLNQCRDNLGVKQRACSTVDLNRLIG